MKLQKAQCKDQLNYNCKLMTNRRWKREEEDYRDSLGKKG